MITRDAVLSLLCMFLINQDLSATDWPSFRGPSASGVAKDARPPLSWNGETGENIRWKTPIPGLGHSSPAISGDRIFITSATSENPNPTLKVGLYGESPEHPEQYVHQYRLYCISKTDGRILWERIAKTGLPQVKRHLKSSHANCTPATDGKNVLAFYGSEGLYCYDMDGNLKWKRDFGYLDAGAFNDHSIQWGFGGSPIIYKDKVVVLCDVNNQSFLTVLDLKTGKDVWRTDRDEVPTWGTPTVVEHQGVTQIVVNGFKHIGAYNFETGEPLWQMKGGGDVPVPTPIIANDMAYITNAHGAPSPLYAVKLSARGDVTLKDDQDANHGVAWRHLRRGAYMSTPIVYGDYLYVGNNRGVLTCFEAVSGKQVFRTRIAGRGGAYTASPVAADGKLYYTDEEGDIHVLKAGPEYVHLSTNPMGEVCLATPAISGDMLIFRTSKHLVGVGDTGGKRLAVNTEKAAEPKASGADKRINPEDIKVDVKDPSSIFRRVDATAASFHTVAYDVDIQVHGAMKTRGVAIKASVLASGESDNGPTKYWMDASLTFPNGSDPVQTRVASAGDMYYGLNHKDKLLHKDLEYSVLGHFGVAGRALVYEFHMAHPFRDEIKADSEILGSKTIGGVDCWEISLVYQGSRPGSKTVWYIGKKDYLPRARHNIFPVEGEEGGVLVELSNLKVSPKTKPESFRLQAPEGYTVTDKAPGR